MGLQLQILMRDMTERMISVNMSSSDTDDEDKRLTVNPTKCVHEAIAEAFGCENSKWRIVQRVLFGDIDVLEGESFEDHGIEWALAENSAVVCLSVGLCFFWGKAAHNPSLIRPCVCVRVRGHQDGARLSVSIKTRKASFAEVAAEVVACNPDRRS
jgi:hypothetical protein